MLHKPTIVFNLEDVINNPSPLLHALTYPTYKEQRGRGYTHEQLIKMGLGDNAMRDRYDREANSKSQNPLP